MMKGGWVKGRFTKMSWPPKGHRLGDGWRRYALDGPGRVSEVWGGGEFRCRPVSVHAAAFYGITNRCQRRSWQRRIHVGKLCGLRTNENVHP